MPKYTMHVVSHTHWDREWYLPLQLFRQKLVDLMDRLLDLLDRDPEFKYFTMDGQSIVLKDYLEIRPENEAKLREYIRQGRIIVGPWYLLNDQFLVSAEANVRSLLVGMKIARDFGNVMMIGYSPDQFGNISQLPQILQGFGIDNAIFGRGIQMLRHPKMEFLWESPDGTQVLSVLMPLWYNNAQHIPNDPEKIEDYLNYLKDKMAPMASVPHLLLMNGVDHLEAQYDVSDAIRLANSKMKNVKLIHSTLTDYISDLKKGITKSKVEMEVIRGELREDDHSQVLAGTLSSRMYLKQANEASQTWLERYAEPLASCAWMLGTKYPAGELSYAWKMLLENHPHDSICGCSTDQVHKEMMIRNDQVDQIGEDLTQRATKKLAAQINTDSDTLIVFNTLAWKRTDKVTATVDFPLGPYVRSAPIIDHTIRIRAMELRNSDGNLVPFAVLDVKNADDRLLDPSQLPMVRMVKRFTIEFIAEDVPACGYKTYKVAVADRMPKFEGSLADTYSGQGISNDQVSASFTPGSGVCIERLDSEEGHDDGTLYFGLNAYEDGGDAGDEYRYMKPIQDIIANSVAVGAQTSIIDHSPISATCKIEQTMMLPESATADGRGRSDSLAACPITTYVTVTKGSPRIDFRVEVDNNAKDHRLRVLFPTDLETDCSHAEAHFDVVTRQIDMPDEWVAAATSHPQRTWVDVNDGEKGLCIVNKGLPEYELYDDTSRTLAITLLRCVNRLAGGADSTISRQVPEAQCLGKRVFEYAVYPHTGTWEEAQVWRQAHQHNVPLYTVQTEAHDGPLPSEMSFVEVEPAELVVTAIKKAENDDRLIVRFFNTTDKPVSGKITIRGARSAELTDLNEEPGEALKMGKDGSVKMKVAGKKIVTVGLGF